MKERDGDEIQSVFCFCGTSGVAAAVRRLFWFGAGPAFAGGPPANDPVGPAMEEPEDGAERSGLTPAPVVDAVIRHRDFLLNFDGYDDHLLYDLREIRDRLGHTRMGVILLDPSGVGKTLVIGFKKGVPETREYAAIPEKTARDRIRKESIRVADARELARSIVQSLESDRQMRVRNRTEAAR
jgi:hypothetical protein